jgi:hypothetical protein
MMRSALAAFMALLCVRLAAAQPPTSVEVTIEPQKFGDVSSILKVDSTIATFKFDEPVTHLALVLEAFPKEPQRVPVARLALDLARPVKEGRLCVQMADQGFVPLGNGAPHQMQLFMQLDCGGAMISSSQSFLKEKFNFSRSLARLGPGTVTRAVTGHRAPVFWVMGNSDTGTYSNHDDLEKMIVKNRDAYVLIASLETSKDAAVLARGSGGSSKAADVQASKTSPAILGTALPAMSFVGPPYPVPSKAKEKDEVHQSVAMVSSERTKATRAGSSSSGSAKKKKRGS